MKFFGRDVVFDVVVVVVVVAVDGDIVVDIDATFCANDIFVDSLIRRNYFEPF